jgi:thioredoxin-like negative regulator of GroEL
VKANKQKMKTIRFFAAVVLMMTVLSVNAASPVKNVKMSSFSEKEQLTYNKAEKDFSYEEYQVALPGFLSLLEQNPEDLDLNFHVGMCYFFMKDSEKAAIYLDKASTDRSLKIRIEFLKKLTEKNSIIL